MIRNVMFGMMSVALVACGGSNYSDGFQGSWIEQSPDGLSGVGLEVNGDNYVVESIVITGPTTAEAQVEEGTFAAGPNEFDTFPTNDTLILGLPQGTVTFHRNDAAPDSNVVITYGCFASGNFVPNDLTKVNK